MEAREAVSCQGSVPLSDQRDLDILKEKRASNEREAIKL